MRAYDYLHHEAHLLHTDLLGRLWGFDISAFGTELATINLYRQDLSSFHNFPRIVLGDYFDRSPGETIPFPPAKTGGPDKVLLPIPLFDAVIGNPPYLRSQNQDDLDPKYKDKLFNTAARNLVAAPSKTDLFAFFVYKTPEMLKPGGRLGFVTSASWLTASFGTQLQQLLLGRLRPVALVTSTAESFFSQVDVNTVILIAENRESSQPKKGEILRFVTLKKRLDDLFSSGPSYWTAVQAFVDKIEVTTDSWEDENARVNVVDASKERQLLEGGQRRNWSLFLRAPLSYFRLGTTGNRAWVRLSEIASIGLGFKSLQNQFFYLDAATSAEYGIEGRFLKPLLRKKDLQPKRLLQEGTVVIHLFSCDLPEPDLRGTNALRYIRAMGSRPAAAKKQGGKPQSIKEALAAQSGDLWYAPKAVPHGAHVWLRKAFDGVYAPFLFQKPVVVDQRCNRIAPRARTSWEIAAALATSTVFALSLESEGGASMGAGALEVSTSQLRELLVPDLRQMNEEDRGEFVRLARSAWQERPVDWREAGQPGPRLRALDGWLLSWLGSSVTLETLYQDLRETCQSRFRVAADKAQSVKKSERQDVEAVAETIAASVRPLLESKQFPEAFGTTDAEVTQFEFPLGELVVVSTPFMTEAHVEVRHVSSGRVVLDKSFPREVGELIVRALLMGRRAFAIPVDLRGARAVLAEFHRWLPRVIARLDEGCRQSAVGTRFEDAVRGAAMARLGLDQRVTLSDPFGEFEVHFAS